MRLIFYASNKITYIFLRFIVGCSEITREVQICEAAITQNRLLDRNKRNDGSHVVSYEYTNDTSYFSNKRY